MKIKALLTTSLLVLFCIVGQAQNNVFDKLAERKDIGAVHISKSLLNMLPEMKTGSADITKLADKLEQIDIYTSESTDAAGFMKKQADLFGTDKTYEVVMTVKEKSQSILFYGKKTGATFKDLVMIVNEPSECIIIRLKGDFTAQDIQKVIKK